MWHNKNKNELYNEFPFIKLVGSSYEGISIPDCVEQGRNAAQEMLNTLFKTQTVQ